MNINGQEAGTAAMKRRRILMFLLCIFLIFALIPDSGKAAASSEKRAVWVSFGDFYYLGLKNKSKASFTANSDKFLKKAAYNGINTVFFHARAFDDATFSSSVFRASKYITSSASSAPSRTTFAAMGYDPLKTFTKEAHKYGIKVEAWINPYRITYDVFYDPSDPNVTGRIKKCVAEVMACGVDGIHFDDYFYHAKKGYRKVGESGYHKVSITAANKRTYVNRMLKSVYPYLKSLNSSAVLGISPQGYINNSMACGADVKGWLAASPSAPVDYVMPQLYWTDKYYSSWTGSYIRLFSRRVKEWKAIKKNNVKLCAGLALYRAGIKYRDDKGWAAKISNLKSQIIILRSSGFSGYAFFSSRDLYKSGAKASELKNARSILNAVYATSIKTNVKSKTIYKGKRYRLSVTWKPAGTNQRKVKFKTSNKRIATVSSKGTITAKKPGKARITVTSSNGKKATVRIKVRKFRR